MSGIDIQALRAKWEAATNGATDAAFMATDKYEIDGETWSRIFLHWDDEKCVTADMMTDEVAEWVVAAHAAFPELLAMAERRIDHGNNDDLASFQADAAALVAQLEAEKAAIAKRLDAAQREFDQFHGFVKAHSSSICDDWRRSEDDKIRAALAEVKP